MKVQKTTRAIILNALKMDGSVPPEKAAELLRLIDEEQTDILVYGPEAARLLGGVSTRTVRNYAARGLLRKIKGHGMRPRYSRREIERLVSGQSAPARGASAAA